MKSLALSRLIISTRAQSANAMGHRAGSSAGRLKPSWGIPWENCVQARCPLSKGLVRRRSAPGLSWVMLGIEPEKHGAAFLLRG
ncbi:MAG: hypothetical protein ACLRVT_02525 [Oscillospiraceae bacterium]